ncbi:MAG: hypothetical protein RLZZ511_2743 [Cyanobacteriota bacterium]|jgi:precorrin-4/cobalt-precorrin-4 C11-methyltransferase
MTAKVYFIGAGPGDPELITVKGQRLLEQANTIVYTDSLIPPTLLRGLKPDVNLVPSADKSLPEIIEILVHAARSGQCVVRLQDGDPSLYGAIQEQMKALAAENIEFELIPGVSAYQLAAARLQVELTQPQQVQTVILTRMGGRIAMPPGEELASLAAHRASLCLYLSAKNVAAAEAELLQHYPAKTPVAICFRLGWPDEQIVLVNLAKMAETTTAENLQRTTLYVISPALEYSTLWDSHQAETFRSRLYDGNYDRLFKPVE